MATSGEKQEPRGRVQVPLWTVIITYTLCWALGAFLAVTAAPGDWHRLVAALLFVIWPMSGTSPLELIRAWKGQGA